MAYTGKCVQGGEIITLKYPPQDGVVLYCDDCNFLNQEKARVERLNQEREDNENSERKC